MVECVRLTEPVPAIEEDRQSLLLAGGGGLVVPGQVLDDAQMVEGVGLAGPVPGIRAAARAAW